MSFKLVDPFDAMARTEADLTSSWEQLSPSATPRPSLQAASPGDLSSVNEEDDESLPLLSRKIAEKRQGQKKKLSMIFGVTIPCCLSIFSVILFLRLGFVLGQAGYWQTLVMIILGYSIVVLTVLSISAIATSATVEGGGVYCILINDMPMSTQGGLISPGGLTPPEKVLWLVGGTVRTREETVSEALVKEDTKCIVMISRALGPEFGGSVGVIFFIANVFSSALYLIGFVEALTNNLGTGGSLLHCENGCGLPSGYWFNLLYGTGLLVFCLLVCLIGAGLFAKTSFIIFCAVIVSLASVMFSFGYQDEKTSIPVPKDNQIISPNITLNYTSWNWGTFVNNLSPNYTTDYTQNAMMSFQAVFAIMFNGCTGIMAGANISGDLKNPSVSIPQGTLFACGITFAVYLVLFTFSSFTCSRELLLSNYNYLQDINVVPPLITVGVFAATLSAALSNLIGASRVLQALAKDRLFSGVLHPFTWAFGRNKEPIPAVLFSWALVQLTLFIGQLNTIAPIVTMFFLVSYGVVNLACFAMKVASAPNFRPTFQVYARYTSALGALSCIVLMFVINAEYAGITVAVMILLFVYLLIRAPATPWGDVSQALIYHQVRKYLLRLDIRKSHVKFWRPEILLLVANPRSSYRLIEFTNDLKKGGLFVLGHVIQKPFSTETAHYHSLQLNTWLTYVEISKVKAFVELALTPSIRTGVQSLLTTSGLGGMKPNTLAMGFYSTDIPISTLDNLRHKLAKKPKLLRYVIRDQSLEKFDRVSANLPELRTSEDEQPLSIEDYVAMIQDAATMGKNVCIMRHFESFEKWHTRSYIDVWPLRVQYNREFDNTFMLVLQLACVLHMKQSRTKIRIFVIIENDMGTEREILQEFLKETRIEASIHMITPPKDHHFCTFSDSFTTRSSVAGQSLQYHKLINTLMQQYSSTSGVLFTALPPLPSDPSLTTSYMKELEVLSDNVPPIVMVHGNMPVMSSTI